MGPQTAKVNPGRSLVEAQLKDGTVVGITSPVNPAVINHLVSEMRSTGFLVLWNATQSIAIEAKRVVAIRVLKIAEGETK